MVNSTDNFYSVEHMMVYIILLVTEDDFPQKVKDEWSIPGKISDFQMIRKIYTMQVRVRVFL